MFKEFWNNKKSVIEVVGILIAIGAIFISIQQPQNENAKLALLNIQLFWLVVITISIVVLTINFWIFFSDVEDSSFKGKRMEYEPGFSAVILIVSGWVIYNLWQYIFAIYHDQLMHLLKIVYIYLTGSVIFLTQYAQIVIRSKNKFIDHLYTHLIPLTAAVILSLLYQLSRLKFDASEFYKMCLSNWLVVNLALLLLVLFKIVYFKFTRRSATLS